jgi:hypothetical protein
MARRPLANSLITMAALAVAAVLVPAAAAQDASPHAEVFAEGAAGPVDMAAGDTAQQTYNVIFTASNFHCQGEAIFVVTVAASGQPAGANVTLDQSELNFTVGSGLHQSVAGSEPAYNESQPVAASVETSTQGVAEPNFTLAVTASYDGTTPAGCTTAMGGFPESSASVNTQFMVTGGTGVIPGAGLGGNVTDEPANGNTTENGGDSPAPATPLIMVATLLAAFALRARRRA